MPLSHRRPRGAEGTLLDAQLARRWLDLAIEGLLASRSSLDHLNVFPVPDGDTGTNLHLTLDRAREEVVRAADSADRAAGAHGETGAAPQGVGELVRCAARGALLGAKGNSGVILSQLLHGWADALAGVQAAGASHVAAAFARADEQAWVAVESPAEGTILSVSRAASRAAVTAGAHGDVGSVVAAAVVAARAALQRTTAQLEVLRRAGVVDAGAAGLVVVLEALAAAVTGSRQSGGPADGVAAAQGSPPSGPHPDEPAHRTGDSEAFEVMFLLDTDDTDETDDVAVSALRSRLAGLGSSVAVVGGHGRWNVHVHTGDPASVVAAGRSAGRTHAVSTTPLLLRPGLRRDDEAAADAAHPGATDVVVLACTLGPGLATAFRGAGAVPVPVRPGKRVTAEELLAAARTARARCVVVLPNGADVDAQLSDRAPGMRVVATRTPVQGLAAVAVHDTEAPPDRDLAAMTAAAAHCRVGAVRVARGGLSGIVHRPGPAQAGDDDEVVAAGAGIAAVAAEVAGALLAGGGELLTLVLGAGVPGEVGEEVAVAVRARHPGVEVAVVDGGQPGDALLVGVE